MLRCQGLMLVLLFGLGALVLADEPGKAPAKGSPKADESRKAPAKTGLQKEVYVGAPTRLDWKFIFKSTYETEETSKDAVAEALEDYDSKEQRYLLYVPKNYKPAKAWPLVLFISPADGSGRQGWPEWEKTCKELGLIYCEPYDAGNDCPVPRRVRIVLDVLDDVRRNYHIDPDQTYLTGHSGGGRMACSIGYALPDSFGAILPICGANPLLGPPEMCQRVKDRLSVAFITGTEDFNRQPVEEDLYPPIKEGKIRTKLWVVEGMGHGIPDPEILREALQWVAKDLPRRQADTKARQNSPGKAPPTKK